MKDPNATIVLRARMAEAATAPENSPPRRMEVQDIPAGTDAEGPILDSYTDAPGQRYHHSAGGSPIHRLPEDVMREIFVACLPSCGNPTIRCRTHAPLSLLQVCGEWQNLAYDIPTLWARLTIELDIRRERSDGVLDRTREWLQRSRSYPLHLCITGSADRQDSFTERIQLLVIATSFRWETLDFDTSTGPYDDDAGFLRPIMNVESPSLRSLSVKPRESSKYLWSQSRLLTSPGLRKISVNNCCLRTSPSSIFSDSWALWSRLTTLVVRDVYPSYSYTSEFFTPLRSCQALETLHVTIVRSTTYKEPIGQEEIILPRLRVLHIFPDTAQLAQPLMRNLVVPAIMHLSYHVDHLSASSQSIETSETNLDTLLSSSHVFRTIQLRSLSLNPEQIGVDKMYQLFKLLPGLESLALATRKSAHACWRPGHPSYYSGRTDNTIGDEFLDILSSPGINNLADGEPRPAPSFLLPYLSKLELSLCTSFSENAFAKFLQARCWRIYPGGKHPMLSLSFLMLEGPGGCCCTSKLLHALKPYEEDGLEVELVQRCDFRKARGCSCNSIL